MVKILNEAEKTRIARAISEAESLTGGEIAAVITGQSGDYRYISLGISIALSFIAAILLYFFWPVSLMSLWLVQGVVLFLAFFLLQATGTACFAPVAERQRNVRRLACEQFLTQGLHNTHNRAAILIFISLQEHCVELITDSGLQGKEDQPVWQGIIDKLVLAIGAGDLAAGVEQAVAASAGILARHFPQGEAGDNNLLRDEMIEI
ncbi:MAG: hypothetical protein JWM96_756 [Alphaproteobacteria bacterium]|nr:hypothetical protein [Alphaproteobacteria bacterium]